MGNRLADGAPPGVTLYAYDDANRMVTSTLGSTAFNYVWDNNGNLLGNNGAPGSYFYDAANRLTSLVNTAVFTYDGLGDRVQMSQTVPIIYSLDQAAGLTQVLAETAGAGTPTTYLYGLDRLSQQKTTGTDYFLGDALGSVRELADSTGKATLRKSYDPYGQTLSSTGSDSSNFDFAGEYKDPSALFYLRARYYTGKRGRFIQKDTWNGDYSNPQTLDAWAYSLSNPVNHTDPSGHCPMPPANLQPAICLALFIKPPTVAVAGGLLTLHGDGRDFSSNSDPSASRGYLWLSVINGKWESHMNRTGYILPFPGIGGDGNMPFFSPVTWFEPSPQNKWDPETGSDGRFAVTYDLVLAGFLENTAPHINGVILFEPRGDGGYKARGVRDGFPWAEAYYYDGKGNVETIFTRPAIDDNPENLNALENEIPCYEVLYHLRNIFFNFGVNQVGLKHYPQADIFTAQGSN